MPSSVTRIVLMAALATTCALLLVLTLWPNHVDGSTRSFIEQLLDALAARGAPVLISYEQVEFALNVVMFLVPAALIALLSKGKGFPWIVLGGGATSVVVEVLQLTVLPNRTPSVLDVMANGLGSLVGAGAVIVGYALLQPAQPPTQPNPLAQVAREGRVPNPLARDERVPNPVAPSLD